MKKVTTSIVGILVMALSIMSCKKNDTGSATVILNADTVYNLMADTIHDYDAMGTPIGGTGKYTFYSLERNAIVTDTATATWDLGFKGTTIRINGGTSGNKSGAAFVQQGLFADVKNVSTDSTFKVDAAPNYAIVKGSGNGWYNYDPTTRIITAIPGKVLIIRTASGKYAKVEILSYYKNGVTPAAAASLADKALAERYYKFQFVYQPDGTIFF